MKLLNEVEESILYWIEWNTKVRLTELVWFIVQNKMACGLCVGVIVCIYIPLIYIFTASIILYTCIELNIVFKCKRWKPISFNLK